MPATTKSEFFATLLCDIGIRSPAAFAVTVPVREIFPRLEKSRAATGSVATLTKILNKNSPNCEANCRGDGSANCVRLSPSNPFKLKTPANHLSHLPRT